MKNIPFSKRKAMFLKFSDIFRMKKIAFSIEVHDTENVMIQLKTCVSQYTYRSFAFKT